MTERGRTGRRGPASPPGPRREGFAEVGRLLPRVCFWGRRRGARGRADGAFRLGETAGGLGAQGAEPLSLTQAPRPAPAGVPPEAGAAARERRRAAREGAAQAP